MSELSKYKIEPGDPDPRGWNLVGSAGRTLGTVVDLLVDTEARKVRQLLVDVGQDAGDTTLVTVPIEDVELKADRREAFARGQMGAAFDVASAPRYTGTYSRDAVGAETGDGRLTRTEEELRIGKREVSRGEVRVGKHVETEQVREPVTRRREEVVIERRPVSGDHVGDAATIGDAEVRVPLMEEEVIVEKRPVVKEELVIGKRVVEERDVVEAEVRKEQFDIDDPSTREREGRPSSRPRRS
jgi:uncharacterized protein (TIGR02271 family)